MNRIYLSLRQGFWLNREHDFFKWRASRDTTYVGHRVQDELLNLTGSDLEYQNEIWRSQFTGSADSLFDRLSLPCMSPVHRSYLAHPNLPHQRANQPILAPIGDF